MFGFMFRSATYLVLFRKFKKQISLLFFSLIAIAIISFVYQDLYEIIAISNEESIIKIFLLKWCLIFLIIGFNIYKLKHTKLDKKEIKQMEVELNEEENISSQAKEVLNKKKLITTTDLILDKYRKEDF